MPLQEKKYKSTRDAYYAAHREEIIARSTAWNTENTQKRKAIVLRYDAKHREEKNSKQKKHREIHGEEVRAYESSYREKHREKILTSQRRRYAKHGEESRRKSKKRSAKYRMTHPEKVRASNIAYRIAHPEVISAVRKRRRAFEHGATIRDFTSAQWLEMQAAYDHRCSYCGKRRKGKLTQDHITPLSRGGNHTLSNIVPACRSCNAKKHAGPVLTPVQPLML